MKIAIIAATGKAGKLLLKEAVARGHEVTAIVRNASKLTDKTINVIEKDILDITYNDVKNAEVIIDAFGAFTPDTLYLYQKSMKHLADILGGKPNRLMIVGGAGSLYVDKEHTLQLIDTKEFPDAWKSLASAMADGFYELRERNDVNWTFLSPAAMFIADGARTGKYKEGKDELILNSEGKSEISYADYAVAMIDEAEKGNHVKERYTVVSM